jgi:hypothetical protein
VITVDDGEGAARGPYWGCSLWVSRGVPLSSITTSPGSGITTIDVLGRSLVLGHMQPLSSEITA